MKSICIDSVIQHLIPCYESEASGWVGGRQLVSYLCSFSCFIDVLVSQGLESDSLQDTLDGGTSQRFEYRAQNLTTFSSHRRRPQQKCSIFVHQA